MASRLDPYRHCPDADEFAYNLERRVVGQHEAVEAVTEIITKHMAGLSEPDHTIANLLLLGPTGTGKTKLVESVADVLFDDPHGFLKIDCSEFQHSHEVAKLIGSPPGYLGHDSTRPRFSQNELNKYHTDQMRISLVLLDEIEKAHQAFWDILLGILDKGELTDNKGSKILFTQAIIFMTSNLGARDVLKSLKGTSMGFQDPNVDKNAAVGKVAIAAAIKNFSPEFMNRLDKILVFRPLTSDSLRYVLEIELGKVQKRILNAEHGVQFVFRCADNIKSLLLEEGTSSDYGARFLKRIIEKRIVMPLANLAMTGQVEFGDVVEISYEGDEVQFNKVSQALIKSGHEEWKDYQQAAQEQNDKPSENQQSHGESEEPALGDEWFFPS